MATIKKMPEEKYPARPFRLQWRDSEGKRHYEFFPSHEDARAKLAGLDHRMLNLGERIVPRRITFAGFVGAKCDGEKWELLEEGEGWFARKGAKPSTRRAWEVNLRVNLLTRFGDWQVQSISDLKIETYLGAVRRNGRSEGTAGGILRLLHLILTDAKKRGIIIVNPAVGVKIEKAPEDYAPEGERPKRNSTWFRSEAQIAAFTKRALELFAPPRPWGAFFVVALTTGLREGELLALQWADVEMEGKAPRLNVRRAWDRVAGYIIPKSKSALRCVPLLPETRKALLTWKAAAPQKKPDSRVFPYDAGAYRRALRAILKAEPDLPRVSLHCLRHSFASLCAGRGVPPRKLADWLGHAKIEMTMNYYAHGMDDDPAVVERYLSGVAGVS